MNHDRRLGAYEIRSLLGKGGMGEVYRARDHKLGRDVAIKLLPRHLVDGERLVRLEREARLLASLNHPNVATIHGLEEAQDGDETPRRFLVLELVEGETLDARLRSGPVSVGEALKIAVQIARGLAAAHGKGIVHRDLKPTNLMQAPDGRVKILDFGVAKMARPLSDDGETEAGEEATAAGVLVGTVGYMAPEQVAGKPVSSATDVFALGIVIWEMLTGAAPFRRSTAAETMTAILKEDAPPLPASVPAPLRASLRRCLEKRPEDRFQSAHDLALTLDSFLSAPEQPATVEPPVGAVRLSRRHLVFGAAAGAAGLAAGFGVGAFISGSSRSGATPSYQRLTFRRGMIRTARFEPDFANVVYGALWDGDVCRIYRVRPESPESAPLPLPPAAPLAVSRSGELALALGDHDRGIMTYGTLARVPLAGGAPRELLEGVKYADWSPDGGELAVVRRLEGREWLEYPLGNVVAEPSMPGGGFSFPRVSPTGDRVAFFELTQAGGLSGRIGTASRTGERAVLSPVYFNVFGLAWRGEEIWFTAADDRWLYRNVIHAIGSDGAVRAVARIPGNASLHDISPDGRVLMAHTDDRGGIAVLTPGAQQERDVAWLDAPLLADISRDGSTILFHESGVGGGSTMSVYVRATSPGASAVRLGDGAALALSPDGGAAIVAPVSPGTPRSHLDVLPTGPGTMRRIERPGFTYGRAAWLPDGRRIVVAAREREGDERLYVLTLEDDRMRAITPEGVLERNWTLSPDGAALAVVSDRGPETYPLDGVEPSRVVGIRPGDRLLAWIEGGLLVSEDPNPLTLGSIFRVDPISGERQLWRRIEARDPAGIMSMHGFVATPDGASYGYSWHRALSDLYLVDGLR